MVNKSNFGDKLTALICNTGEGGKYVETIKSLTKEVAAATGSKKAQLVLKNARIVNVFTQSVEEGDIAIEEGRIVGIGTYDGVMESDLKGAYVCPGF